MRNTHHDESAFARPMSRHEQAGYTIHEQPGMTTYAYFTAAAMQGLAANAALNDYSIKELGEMAAQLANETITAMNKFTPSTP